MIKRSIEVHNRIVFDDGDKLFYTTGLSVLTEGFAYLMEMSIDDVITCFNDFKDITFEFIYDEKTTIEEFYFVLLERMGFKKDPRTSKGGWDGGKPLYFLTDNLFIGVDDYSHIFEDSLERFSIKTVLNSVMLFVCSAGDIWNDDGLRYFMRSREGCRHKVPHVHVEYRHEEEASIDIRTGDIISGNMRQKRLKTVKEKVLCNQKFLLKCWNDQTDGFSVDINHYLGITPILEDPYKQFYD